MRNLFSLVMPFAVIAPTAVLAADYDPPLVVEQEVYVDEAVPVEVGSGWYLRGDVSYRLNSQRYDGITFLGAAPVTNIRFGGSIGAGYHFTDWFRLEGELGFMGLDRARIDAPPLTASASHNAWSGMLNAYADLGTVAKFTPYVGAGVGLLRTQHSLRVQDPTVPLDVAVSGTQYRFAYSAMAGVAYRLTDNLSLDVGYRFFASPGTEQINFDTQAVERGVTHHQIRAGLRYDLW